MMTPQTVWIGGQPPLRHTTVRPSRTGNRAEREAAGGIARQPLAHQSRQLREVFPEAQIKTINSALTPAGVRRPGVLTTLPRNI